MSSNVVNNEQLQAVTSFFVNVFKQAQKELQAETPPNPADEIAQALAEINAKVNVTVAEAALLLGCSDSHIYKKIKLAKQNKSNRPIPYNDLDGVYSLPREALLKWAAGKRLKLVSEEAKLSDTSPVARKG